MSIANVYASIVKMDDNGDGTLTVYGKATDDTLDIDQQICDPVWLDRAMPEWFMSGGNIREQHSNIAAGVAEEYEKKADGHYISALVVDPVSVKKVKARVLKGFSIGIKSPRVVKDNKAVNGRIVDGQIVEVSLVDRPANPNAKLILAKSAVGLATMVKTEELIEKHGDHDQSDHNPHGGGGSSSNEQAHEAVNEGKTTIGALRQDAAEVVLDLKNEGASKSEVRQAQNALTSMQSASDKLEQAESSDNNEDRIRLVEDAMNDINSASSAMDTIDHKYAQSIVDELDETWSNLDSYLADLDSNHEPYLGRSAQPKYKERQMARRTKAAKSAEAKEADGMPMNGEAKAIPSRDEMMERYAGARKALDEVMMMCKEYGYEDIEKQYGETAEQETVEGPMVGADTAQEEVSEARQEKPLDKELVMEDGEEELKSVSKCLECGCNMPGQSHGNPDVSTAVMVSPDQTPVPTPAIQPPTPKSVGTIVPPSTIEEVGTIIEEEDSDEEDSADKSLLADVNIHDIVEKAVKSAIASVEAQVAELKSAKEAVENKAAELESELATAKSLAIGGGPKRTTMATGANTTNEWRAKADLYFAKAAATTDNDLAKGYREMAKDFLAKSQPEVKA
jgi:hypothetical protein